MGYFALEAPPWQEAGEVTGRALGSRQFHVGLLASADCSAGIPDGDALYLVRSRFQSLRGGVNDVGFHRFQWATLPGSLSRATVSL